MNQLQTRLVFHSIKLLIGEKSTMDDIKIPRNIKFCNSGVGCIYLLLFIIFLIVDIIVIHPYIDSTCDQNINLWIEIHIICLGMYAFVRMMPISNCTGCLQFATWLGEISVLIWGIVIIAESDTCQDTMPSVYNLMLSQLIIIPLVMVIDILVIIVTLCIICGFVCCITALVMQEQDALVISGNEPYIYDQV